MIDLADSLPYSHFLGMDLIFHPFTLGLSIVLALIVVLLFFSGLMSGSEVSYFSLSLSDRNKLNKKASRAAQTAVDLLAKPEYLLSTILLANNVVNVAIVILSTYFTNELIDFTYEPVVGFVFQIVVITFVLLLIGEIMPKILATYHPLRFVVALAVPLSILYRVFKPLSYLLINSTSLINKRLSAKPMHNISMDDLSDAIEMTAHKTQENKSLLQGIVEFVNTEASEIMTSRLDVVGIDISHDYKDLKQLVLESGYSRLLVYDETPDNVKGVLYVKDLLPFLEKDPKFNWTTLIRRPYFIPENKKINDLLVEFQSKKIHLAIVVDEYGGTCGIVSLEDILEEIVGEISDESDEEEEKTYVKVDDNTYIFEGKTLLNDFAKIVDVDDDVFEEARGEAETLAGLLLELKGDFLQKGEEIKYGDFDFKVEQVDRRRIRKIKVTIKRDASNKIEE